MKNLLSTHIIYAEADHTQVLGFQRASNSSCNVYVLYLALKGAPNRNCNGVSTLLSKGPHQHL